jgi:formimidoylglutamate deiminase
MAIISKYFQFNALLLNNTWLQPAYVGVDQNGLIKYLSDQTPQDAIEIEKVEGIALPGFQNAHSHAFQYAMAGLAEKHKAGDRDNFWTWREAMYQCALSVDPDQMEAIAAMLYCEMLRHGYTHVAEFHYLHHDKNGKRYSNAIEMGERLLAAAQTAGIKITLIPVFYQKGGFGQPPQERQCRFISDTVDDYFKLLEASKKIVKLSSNASLGFSVHSLRAVNADDIIETFRQGPADLPFHLHLAEQRKEVVDCEAFLKQRPASWLLDNLPVDERFFLIHGTHFNDDEVKRIATSGATVVLCPSTEGNLGDGFFRMKDYFSHHGNWCIGTDSHIGLNPLEEFRMIDYRQRLLSNLRNTFAEDGAAYMADNVWMNGRKGMGNKTENYFAADHPLDAVVYDANAPLLSVTYSKNLLNTIVYASDATMTLGTLVNGKWVVRSNIHSNISIKLNFVKAIRSLKNR